MFPTIVDPVTSIFGTSLGANRAFALPANSAAGDFVIYIVANDNTSSTALTGSTGWTLAGPLGTTAMKSAVFGRVLTGTTGIDILSVSGAAQDYAVVGGRTPAGEHSITSGNIATWATNNVSAITGASGNANPPLLNTGGIQEHLWIIAGCLDMTATGDAFSGVVTNFTLFGNVKSASSTSSVGTRADWRQLNAAQLDPNLFTNTSRAWHAYTIAIPPYVAPSGTTPVGHRASGVFTDRPVKVKTGGTFVASSMKVKTGGVWIG